MNVNLTFALNEGEYDVSPMDHASKLELLKNLLLRHTDWPDDSTINVTIDGAQHQIDSRALQGE